MGTAGAPVHRWEYEVNHQLREQLTKLGIDTTSIEDPSAAWLALFDSIGQRATLIERYEIEAAHQGIAVEDLSDADRMRMRRQVLPVLFPGWEEAARISQPDPIVVVPYDSSWPGSFSEWRAKLGRALEPTEVRIEHVGSTAVPGLAAKPVIDIMVAVPDVAAEADYVSRVESCGVMMRSRDEGHSYFRPPPPEPRVVQVHVVDLGSDWQRRHLLFRDYLRAHPDAAAAYGGLKTELASVYRDDRLAYNAAKTGFILNHMAIAEEWSTRTAHNT